MMDAEKRPAPDCRIRIGTSGYSYAEWVDAGFYPPQMKAGRMLAFYAGCFSVTELNYTWYQMPKAAAIERMQQQAPADFLFTAKLTRYLTHEVEPDQWRRHAAQYREGMAPLIQSGRLAAVLIQFPPSFVRNPCNRRYLAELLDALHGLPAAVEFRHASWAAERVYRELEQRSITLVSLDMPEINGLFPSLDIITNPDFFYIRFHGRNKKGWRSGNMQQQFDYDYTAAELRRWSEERLPAMAARTRRGFVFFNNHVRARAPANALQLMQQLEQKGIGSHAFGTGHYSSQHCRFCRGGGACDGPSAQWSSGHHRSPDIGTGDGIRYE